MAMIAHFTILSKTGLDEFRKAMSPERISPESFLDAWSQYLAQNGREIRLPDEVYCGSLIANLLVNLQQECKIDLMHSEFDDLANAITRARGATCIFFTEAEKVALLNASAADLDRFFEDFNRTNEPETCEAMLDGVIALQIAVGHASHQNVVLLCIE